MNNKLYVGKRVASLVNYGEIEKIDGIALLVDDENEYVAGSKEGYVLEVTCPYGTQAMADKLYASLGGKTYTGFSAESATIDPKAELGDGITIGGIYSPLANRTVRFGALNMTDIGAPGDSEINHEYEYVSSQQTELNRKLAQTRSYIDKTAEEIRIGVEGVQGTVAELEVSVGKVSSTVSGYDGRISQVEQTATSLTSTVSGLEGDVSRLEQTAGNIKLSVSGSLGGTAYISLSGGSGGSGSIDLSDVRKEWANDTSNVTVSGGTITFNGGGITFNSNTFIANSDNFRVTKEGYLTVNRAILNGAYFRKQLTTNTFLTRYDLAGSFAGNIYLENDDTDGSAFSSKTIYGVTEHSSSSGHPYEVALLYASGNYNGNIPSAVLGYDEYNNIGARINGRAISSQTTIVPDSDRDMKKNITDLPERFVKMLDSMRPVTYRYNWQKDGEPVHWGYIAQEMEEAIANAGMTREDVAALVGEDGSGQMGIGYTELIPIMHLKIRQLEQRLARLEAMA